MIGKTWYSSDTHVNHERIISLSGRPFADVDEMNDGLIERWNDRVAPEDVVWHLGDAGLGDITVALALLKALNGHKILICGNHDRPSPLMNKDPVKREAWAQRYREEGGFRTIVSGQIPVPHVLRKPSHAPIPVTLSHFPYPTYDDPHEDPRFAAYQPKDRKGILLHGHVHEAWQIKGRMINVGVDVNGFAPVAEADLYDAAQRILAG